MAGVIHTTVMVGVFHTTVMAGVIHTMVMAGVIHTMVMAGAIRVTAIPTMVILITAMEDTHTIAAEGDIIIMH